MACESLMTVFAWKVCTPPTYATTPVLYVLCLFSWKYDAEISVLGTVYPLNAVVTENFTENFYSYNDVSTPMGSAAQNHLLPMMSSLSLLCMCNLGPCPFSGLVCDLLLTSRRGLSLKAHWQKSISSHTCNLAGTAWRTIHWFGAQAFRTRGGSTIFKTLRFLVVRETWSWGLASPRIHASPQTWWTFFTEL